MLIRRIACFFMVLRGKLWDDDSGLPCARGRLQTEGLQVLPSAKPLTAQIKDLRRSAEVARERRRDCFRVENQSIDRIYAYLWLGNPSVTFGDSSLCTREPFLFSSETEFFQDGLRDNLRGQTAALGRGVFAVPEKEFGFGMCDAEFLPFVAHRRDRNV